MGYLYVMCAVLATSFGLVSYKYYSKHRKKIYLLLTIGLFLLAPVCNFMALEYLTVDVVYMATSINGFIVLLMSHLVLHEVVRPQQYLGALLVVSGVIVYVG